jgi:hypothetical protein
VEMVFTLVGVKIGVLNDSDFNISVIVLVGSKHYPEKENAFLRFFFLY